jgi:hypothetical protein
MAVVALLLENLFAAGDGRIPRHERWFLGLVPLGRSARDSDEAAAQAE